MSRLPRIDGREAVKKFMKAGFVVSRIHGSHHILVNSSGRTIVVPVHGAEILGPGLLRSLIADAGLTVDKFVRLSKLRPRASRPGPMHFGSQGNYRFTARRPPSASSAHSAAIPAGPAKGNVGCTGRVINSASPTRKSWPLCCTMAAPVKLFMITLV